MLETAVKREYEVVLQKMIEFIENLGLTVNTKTKARGHQGFFLKDRIDISAGLSAERKIEVLIHEFTHYIHAKIDPSIYNNHGTLAVLFPNSDLKKIETELYEVTRYFDKNTAMTRLNSQKDAVLQRIKEIDKEIKSNYPDFKRSYSYKPFEKEIKKSDAKYLLKFDKVRIKIPFFTKTKDYSIKSIDTDFPQMEEILKNYIRLKAQQRLLKRISGRITRLKSYYKRPSELFARFVEALFIDTAVTAEIAPHTYLVFCRELASDRYLDLADFINNFF